MQGLMPEIVVYGKQPGEKYEEWLGAVLEHTLKPGELKQAVENAKAKGYTDIRVVRQDFKGKIDFIEAINF